MVMSTYIDEFFYRISYNNFQWGQIEYQQVHL